jgi:Mn-dependent DtxR family transcriptional regulator
MNIDQHILTMLSARTRRDTPVSISDLARRFGVSPVIVLPAARRLVDDGLAEPWMVDIRGVATLRGLLPVAVTADQAG